MAQPAARTDLPDLPLRHRHQDPAFAKARELTAATGLAWRVEWRLTTRRWHVVVDPASLPHVTPASLAWRAGAPLGTTPPPRRRGR